MRKILFCFLGLVFLGAGCKANQPQSAYQTNNQNVAPIVGENTTPINVAEKFPLVVSLVDEKKLSVSSVKRGIGLEGLDWLAVLNVGHISLDKKTFVVYKNYNLYSYGDKIVYVKLSNKDQEGGVWYGPFKIEKDKLIAELENIFVGMFIKDDLQLVGIKPMWKISNKLKTEKLIEGEKVKFSLSIPQYFKEVDANVFDLPVNDESFCLKYDICETNLSGVKMSLVFNEMTCPDFGYGPEIGVSDFTQALSNSILPDQIRIKNMASPLQLKMYSDHAMSQEDLFFVYEGAVTKGCVRVILNTHSHDPAVAAKQMSEALYDPVIAQKIFLDDFLTVISLVK